MTDLDLFGGPGGWSVAAAELGLDELGIEWDRAACATRAAAGHRTIRADVSQFVITPALAALVCGLIGSPPCTTFSAAGDQAGNAILELLAALIRDLFADRDTRKACRREMEAALTASEWAVDLDEPKRAAKIRAAVFSASLVAEPARYIAACGPEWVALEQVPAVLPLWQVCAAELRQMGYSAWTGKLNAADYGVPQTRERAILIASRVREVRRPEPTHYDDRRGFHLWGQPWIPMAAALGWGMTGRPYFTLATAGGLRGGADEQVGGSGARRALYAERDSGRWTLTRPATTLTTDERLFGPHAGSKGESHSSNAVRISVDEAAALQTFPQGYPWQGNKTLQFQQIGNAVPPLLAIAVLGVATGADWQPIAERYAESCSLLAADDSPGEDGEAA